jgi:hypothetical protein
MVLLLIPHFSSMLTKYLMLASYALAEPRGGAPIGLGTAVCSNNSFTEGLASTTMVKTPSTYPKGHKYTLNGCHDHAEHVMGLSREVSACDNDAGREGPSEHNEACSNNDENPPDKCRHGLTVEIERTWNIECKHSNDNVNNRDKGKQCCHATDDIVKDRKKFKILKVFIHIVNPPSSLGSRCPAKMSV